jgi:hypothetical protein
MRRLLYVCSGISLLIAITLFITFSSAGTIDRAGALNSAAGSPTARGQAAHTITVTPRGPDDATIEAVKTALAAKPALQTYLKDSVYRMLSFVLESDLDRKTGPDVPPPDRYRALFYDYTKQRTIEAAGRLDGGEPEIRESSEAPDPNEEEFQAAVDVLRNDATFGSALRDESLQTYAPMPPLVSGKRERTVAVGLISKEGSAKQHEIVGVNMIQQSVIRFQSLAPETSVASATSCGPPDANQSTTARGTAGQSEIVISREGREIWRFTVIRPAVSTGTRGSAIDLVNVDYLGKRVLRRAHNPILNVQYERDVCGPYRDWSYQEGMFVANGSDVAPGIRICTDPPLTVLDIDSDVGNFRGVAIYDNKERVTLVTEMEAGWYRYLSEWNFYDDGKISPRYAFGATDNSCVCASHHHHVYWRFDFDILGSANNRIFEANTAIPTQLMFETTRPRLAGANRTWIVDNSVSGESVSIIPGPRDGNFDKYGRYDLAFLVFKSNETDDGVNCTQGCDTRANLAPYLTTESVNNTDVVIWYGAHFTHADAANSLKSLTGPHVLGPDLILKKY